jgi:hypothetical protein
LTDTASKIPVRESIAFEVGLKTFCSVGLNHHTLQSAVVFLCRRNHPADLAFFQMIADKPKISDYAFENF